MNLSNSQANMPLIVLGGGGHGKVLIDALLLQSAQVLGFVDPRPEHPEQILGVPWLGEPAVISAYAPAEVLLVNAVGSAGAPTNRRQIFSEYKNKGYSFAGVLHPSAVIGRDVHLGEGVQLLAGAIVGVGSSVGDNTIINTKASIDHDGKIGAHCHLAPGVTLSGGVQIGEQTHLGTGASVIQGITVGAGCVVGAGSLLIRDLGEGLLAYGVPAQVVRELDL